MKENIAIHKNGKIYKVRYIDFERGFIGTNPMVESGPVNIGTSVHIDVADETTIADFEMILLQDVKIRVVV